MAFYHQGKYLAYEKVTSLTVGHSDDIFTIYKKCEELSKKFGVPLTEFNLEAESDYDSPQWVIQFCRPATEEEIEYVKAQELRHVENKRKQYEALKKEFER